MTIEEEKQQMIDELSILERKHKATMDTLILQAERIKDNMAVIDELTESKEQIERERVALLHKLEDVGMEANDLRLQVEQLKEDSQCTECKKMVARCDTCKAVQKELEAMKTKHSGLLYTHEILKQSRERIIKERDATHSKLTILRAIISNAGRDMEQCLGTK